MFFANAVCDSEDFGRETIAICSTAAEEQNWASENTDSFSRVYYERPIAKAIMKASTLGSLPISFECNGVCYTLLKYTYRSEDERFYNKNRKNYVARKTIIRKYTDIYVYSEQCRCPRCFSTMGFSEIENVCAMIQLRDDPRKRIKVDMQHCKGCSSWFIDTQSLIQYERKYGLLMIDKHHITGNEIWFEDRNAYTYKPDTVLSRNGYSTKLYNVERRKILEHLLSTGISNKAEIKDILTRFIAQRGERYPNAKAIWESDLEFINAYEIDDQKVVYFE